MSKRQHDARGPFRTPESRIAELAARYERGEDLFPPNDRDWREQERVEQEQDEDDT